MIHKMANSILLNNYDASEELLKRLYDSRLRLALLDSLRAGPKRLADVKHDVHANAPNTSAKAKDLEAMGLLERTNGDYKLTFWGSAFLTMMGKYLSFCAAYEEYKDFWTTHDISGVPPDILPCIGVLTKAKLVCTDDREIMGVVNKFVELFGKVREYYCTIAPFSIFYDKRLYDIYIGHADNGVKAKFLTTDQALKDLAKEHPDRFEELLHRGVEFYRYDSDLTFSLTSADNLFSVGFFSTLTGKYDLNNNLMSQEKCVIKWGLRFYEYYEQRSELVKKGDYL